MLMSDVLRRFVHANASISGRIVPSMVRKTHAYTRYDEEGTNLLQREPHTVLDVGAGRKWHFTPALKRPDMTLIGFDIDGDEMEENALLDQRICGDACIDLGVPEQSVDLIMGRAVIEHLHDNAAFLKSARRALRDDGRLIVTFANRYAPFAILNRLLPRRISHWLLTHLVPGSAGVLGFEAYYDRASFSEFKQSLTDAGFEIEEEYASYFSTSYYSFFLPLFVVGLSLDYLRYALANPRLASYFLFVARKQSMASSGTAEVESAGVSRRPVEGAAR